MSVFSFTRTNEKDTTTLSTFEKQDLNGVCVFGYVTKLPNTDQSIDEDSCVDGKCQVAIQIKKTDVWKSSSHHLFLTITVSPQGQTVQTLTHIYLNITYPDQHESSFLATVENLSGYHKELLESLEIDFPLDNSRLQTTEEEPANITITLSSRCSCNGSFDRRDIEVFQVPEFEDGAHSKNEDRCPNGKNGPPTWAIATFSFIGGVCLVVLLIAICVILLVLLIKKTVAVIATSAGQHSSTIE